MGNITQKKTDKILHDVSFLGRVQLVFPQPENLPIFLIKGQVKFLILKFAIKNHEHFVLFTQARLWSCFRFSDVHCFFFFVSLKMS